MHSKKTGFGLAMALLCVLAGALLPGGAGCGELETEDPIVVPLEGIAPEGEYVKDEYIFIYKDNVTPEEMGETEKQLEEVGGVERHNYSSIFKGFSAQVSPAGLDRLRRNPALATVRRNGIMHATGIQSCPSWGLDVIDNATNIVANDIYGYTYTGADVHVYVFDTGIQKTHKEFEAIEAPGVNSNRVANGFCGYLSNGCPNDDTKWDDYHGHGTHLAGIVGGHKSGVAKGVTLHSVRIYEQGPPSDPSCGIPTTLEDHFYKGLNEVIPTIPLTQKTVFLFGLSGTRDYWPDLYDVLTSLPPNIVVVASAGNERGTACNKMPGGNTYTNQNPTGPKKKPENVITVGAFAEGGDIWVDSNQDDCVDVFAPGMNILGPVSDDCPNLAANDPAINAQMRHFSGTSQAAAYVAGVAALLMERDNAATATNVKREITELAKRGVLRNLLRGAQDRALTAPQRSELSPLLPDLLTSAAPLSAPASDQDGCNDGARCVNGDCSICEGQDERCGGLSEGGGITCQTNGECAFCGAEGLDCCPGERCAGTLKCMNGVCAACGSEGLACCPGQPMQPNTCDSGFTCTQDNVCKCGGLGQSCCGGIGGTCDTPLECGRLGRCGRCGGSTEPCCPGSKCDDGFECKNNNCTQSMPCGAQGLACCAGDTCNGGLYCDDAKHCEPCGGYGKPCCPMPSAQCDGDMACSYDATSLRGTCTSFCSVLCTNGKLGQPYRADNKFVTQFDCLEWSYKMCGSENGWFARSFYNYIPTQSLVECGGYHTVGCDSLPTCTGNLIDSGCPGFYEDNPPWGEFRGEQHCMDPHDPCLNEP